MQLTFKFILLGVALAYGVSALPVPSMDHGDDVELFPRGTRPLRGDTVPQSNQNQGSSSSTNDGGIPLKNKGKALDPGPEDHQGGSSSRGGPSLTAGGFDVNDLDRALQESLHQGGSSHPRQSEGGSSLTDDGFSVKELDRALQESLHQGDSSHRPQEGSSSQAQSSSSAH